jgi:hypothetical protein
MGRLRDKWDAMQASFQEGEKKQAIKNTLNRLSRYERGEWTVLNGVHFQFYDRVAFAWVVQDGVLLDLWTTNQDYQVTDPCLRQWLYEGVCLLEGEINFRNCKWAAEKAKKEKDFATQHYPNRYSQEKE